VISSCNIRCIRQSGDEHRATSIPRRLATSAPRRPWTANRWNASQVLG
jgi:hypothetical protein